MEFYKQTLIGQNLKRHDTFNNKYEKIINSLFEDNSITKIKNYNINLAVNNDIIFGILYNDIEKITFNIIWNKKELEFVIDEAIKNNADKLFIDTYKKINNFPILIQNKDSLDEDINNFIIELTNFILTE